MAKPPPAQQAQITALPRNDPARGPHLLHVTLAALFDLHHAPPDWLPRVIVGEVAEWQGHSPEQLKHMKDHLQRLKEAGVEAID